jgi:hypothetical protein
VYRRKVTQPIPPPCLAGDVPTADENPQGFQRIHLDKVVSNVVRLRIDVDTDHVKAGLLVAMRTAAGFTEGIE